ncbi:helix-turn-helix domain-containing protein [Microbacterium paraoxydans]|uniref:helix-turn-helix domain-containing protein n=1 Tax=Microbacterium paraoxydans TaxID=199592 RepID=UPI001CFB3670|nr:helix-turn-helix domain-containing protein [Microbacterium paraoxydans]
MVRPAADFLFDDLLILPGNLALQVWTVGELDRALAQARRDRDHQLVEILIAIRTAGLRAKAAAAEVTSGLGHVSRPSPDIGTRLRFITTRQAADRLHVSTRHVLRLLDTGELLGRKVEDRWHIDPLSLPSSSTAQENT